MIDDIQVCFCCVCVCDFGWCRANGNVSVYVWSEGIRVTEIVKRDVLWRQPYVASCVAIHVKAQWCCAFTVLGDVVEVFLQNTTSVSFNSEYLRDIVRCLGLQVRRRSCYIVRLVTCRRPVAITQHPRKRASKTWTNRQKVTEEYRESWHIHKYHFFIHTKSVLSFKTSFRLSLKAPRSSAVAYS